MSTRAERACLVCGAAYTPRQDNQKYCGRRCCRVAACRAWRRRRRRPIQCARFGCERRFTRQAGSRRLYCTEKCQRSSHRRTARALAKAGRAA